ncbi:MAG: hypothetical protein NC548_11415 [Lachnospiraceae bacterium]|nr:hypothetical protein [Lachnospiraceae bacterium]MCM1234714.1 hypothetical protein [Ruminococcus flavefaciens]
MGKVSKLIGEVIAGEPVFWDEIDEESYYKIRVRFLDAEIDVVFSEYILQGMFSGKVEVTGYLASRITKGEKPDFYFHANLIESVDLDTPISNKVTFAYKVTKVGKFKVSQRGVDLLPLVASDYTAQHSTSVLYLCVRGKGARKLKDKEKGYYISGEGFLKQYRDIYEIIILNLEDDGIQEPTEV